MNMSKVTAEKIKNRISEICNWVGFDYKGKSGYVDPYSKDDFAVFYDGETYEAKSIDEVMSMKVFGGKSLTEIADELENVDLG